MKQADVIIKENNEPLVEIKETSRLRLGSKSINHKTIFFVRKSVAEKLIKVSETLPKGINLVIIEGYRTVQAQQESWNREYIKLHKENPTWTNEEIEKNLKIIIAKPSPLANHHCGGAIDITIEYSDGSLVDMGGSYISIAGKEDRKKFPMLSEYINENQAKNRKILRDAMASFDFAWYSAEWWHYCYGDRMWAVNTGKNKCFYGPIEISK